MTDFEKLSAHWEKMRLHLEELDKDDHEAKQMCTMAVFYGGKYDGQMMTEWQVEQKLCNGQHSYDGKETRANGGVCHFAVLDNNPLVDGYLSPMWDGGRLRYETQEVYDVLSM